MKPFMRETWRALPVATGNLYVLVCAFVGHKWVTRRWPALQDRPEYLPTWVYELAHLNLPTYTRTCTRCERTELRMEEALVR